MLARVGILAQRRDVLLPLRYGSKHLLTTSYEALPSKPGRRQTSSRRETCLHPLHTSCK